MRKTDTANPSSQHDVVQHRPSFSVTGPGPQENRQQVGPNLQSQKVRPCVHSSEPSRTITAEVAGIVSTIQGAIPNNEMESQSGLDDDGMLPGPAWSCTNNKSGQLDTQTPTMLGTLGLRNAAPKAQNILEDPRRDAAGEFGEANCDTPQNRATSKDGAGILVER